MFSHFLHCIRICQEIILENNKFHFRGKNQPNTHPLHPPCYYPTCNGFLATQQFSKISQKRVSLKVSSYAIHVFRFFQGIWIKNISQKAVLFLNHKIVIGHFFCLRSIGCCNIKIKIINYAFGFGKTYRTFFLETYLVKHFKSMVFSKKFLGYTFLTNVNYKFQLAIEHLHKRKITLFLNTASAHP